MIVDLSEVRRINIEIVAAFAQLQRSCDERAIALRVCCVDPDVQKVLDKTPITSVIAFKDTFEEAFGS